MHNLTVLTFALCAASNHARISSHRQFLEPRRSAEAAIGQCGMSRQLQTGPNPERRDCQSCRLSTWSSALQM